MNQLTRVQHKYKITSDDFNRKPTNTHCKNPLGMILVSIGLATTMLTPLLSIL
ncbi:hypothetical protein Xentx_03603 [Xenorhabdus thuongxuanensis]|uniref:Uncharacterized protein n=1 Tax=Xenorhabdus thuongxuanensis TaxID=1873484 RepID=A0A1Q5TGU3_9GAMM|nr:hypothetical protein Xentx_03603 [Xenorhabdus thuongxuanensis]